MSNIDLTKLITAEDKAGQKQTQRIALVKGECRRRIFTTASQTTQANLTAASSADLLTAEQKQVWVAALGWVAAMHAACLLLIADPDADYTQDAAWPALPAGVADLVALF